MNYKEVNVDGEIFFYDPVSMDLTRAPNPKTSPINTIPTAAIDKHHSKKTADTISVVLTKCCNMKCIYCFERDAFEDDPHSNKGMPKELLAEVVRCTIREDHAYRMHFFGGEPLLRRELLKYGVEKSKEQARRVGAVVLFSISTNGTMISRNDADYFHANDVEIRVTFDGLPALQDSNRPLHGGGPSYEAVCRSLDNLSQAKCNVHIVSVVTRDDLKLMPHSFEHILPFNPCKIRFVPLINATCSGSSYNSEDIDIYKSSMRRICCDIIASGDMQNIMKFKNVASYLPHIHKHVPRKSSCAVRSKSTFAVNVDGTVYPCTTFLGDANYALGTVKDLRAGSLKAICSHNTACSSCWAINLCGGACIRDNTASKSGCSRPLPGNIYCEFVKADAELALELYSSLYFRNES